MREVGFEVTEVSCEVAEVSCEVRAAFRCSERSSSFSGGERQGGMDKKIGTGKECEILSFLGTRTRDKMCPNHRHIFNLCVLSCAHHVSRVRKSSI